MTLTFLGRQYEMTTAEVPLPCRQHQGCYRGVPTQFSGPVAPCHTPHQLTYRGVIYSR